MTRNVALILALSAPTVEASLREEYCPFLFLTSFPQLFLHTHTHTPSPSSLQSGYCGADSSCSEVGSGAVACSAAAGSRMVSWPHLHIPLFTDRGVVIAFLFSRGFCPPHPGQHAGCIIRSAVLRCWGAGKEGFHWTPDLQLFPDVR